MKLIVTRTIVWIERYNSACGGISSTRVIRRKLRRNLKTGKMEP